MYESRHLSRRQRDAQARELILSAKNKIIADVLEEIKTDIENMGADEYFEFLSKLFGK